MDSEVDEYWAECSGDGECRANSFERSSRLAGIRCVFRERIVDEIKSARVVEVKEFRRLTDLPYGGNSVGGY